MRRLALISTALAALGAAPAPALAAPKGLDAGFGTGGVTKVDFFGREDFANGMATAPDGKIVLVGSAQTGGENFLDFAIVRLNRDGSLDRTFGSGGKRTIDFKPLGPDSWSDYAADVVVEPDGQIVVAGTSREPGTDNRQMTITRLNAEDGSTDLTFGNPSTPGVAHFGLGGNGTEARAIDRFANGGFVVAGVFYGSSFTGWNMTWAKLDQVGREMDEVSGSISFTAGSTEYANDVAFAPDGNFVVAGGTDAADPSYDIAVARRKGSDGEADNSFNTNGRRTVGYPGGQYASAVAVQPDNKVVIVADDNEGRGDFLVHRLTAGGLPDTSFGDPANNGGVFIDFGGGDTSSELRLLPDGKIAVAGTGGAAGTDIDVAVARLTGGGALDSSFGVGGKREIVLPGDQYATGLAVQPDGGFLVAGFDGADFFVMRIGKFTPRPVAPRRPPPPPPPPPALPPVRPGLASVAISARSLKANAKGVVGVRLRCSAAAACRGTVDLTTRGKVSAAAKRRRLKLGRKSYSIAAGKTKTVKVKLRRQGLRLLRKRRTVRARLTITTRRSGAKAAKVGRTVTLKAAQKRKARR